MTTDHDLLARDVEAYLARYQDKELLRLVAVGSVDDGKSTLIGRLLYDTGMVYEDHLAQIRKASAQEGMEIDLSLLTDGLTAEREQGITIDVAYRYFTTDARKFIIADTPGHVQYTRNMVTGASTANVAVILIDARHGVLEQSRRHAYLASLLGIPHLAVCVNKMDLVGFDEARFDAIVRDMRAVTQSMRFREVAFFPVSALAGDNCVRRSERTPYYDGPTVLGYLETVPVHADRNLETFRFPVQLVSRPNLDYRGFAGQIASGRVKPGDRVRVLPSGTVTTVRAIDFKGASLDEAVTPQSVTLRLADEVDVSRGDTIVHEGHEPWVTRRFDAHVVWLHESPLDPTRRYLLKHTTQTTPAQIDAIAHRVDMQTLAHVPADALGLNDVARVSITTHRPLVADAYVDDRATGSFILIDAISDATVGAGMIIARLDDAARDAGPEARDVTFHVGEVDRDDRARVYGHRGALVWLTGLSGSGKSTIAHRVEKRLLERRIATYVLDGDNVRHGLSSDLGFSAADRAENVRRAAEVARLFVDAGLVVLAAFVSPYRADRAAVRARFEADGAAFLEVHVATPIDVCAARDPKGLYAKAREKPTGLTGTGAGAPYEAPERPELVIDTAGRDVDACADAVIAALVARGVIADV